MWHLCCQGRKVAGNQVSMGSMQRFVEGCEDCDMEPWAVVLKGRQGGDLQREVESVMWSSMILYTSS